jgi:hypothetical protein
MQSFSLGAGLAALAFWGFIATVVVAGIWSDIRKRESRQETVRRLFESGQPVSDDLMDKLLSAVKGGSERLDRGLKLTGLIMLPSAVGLALLGMMLGIQSPNAQLPLLGISLLVACVGAGFLFAARIARRWYLADDGKGSDRA